jgi:phosphoadenosine phosphosulfate reductase
MFDCTTLDRPFEITPELAPDFAPNLAPPPRHAPHVEESLDILCAAIKHDHQGRIAVVSSFGADSAVLLALVAEIDPTTPVLFVDTRQHFVETLAYRDTLIRTLGLTRVRTIGPTDSELTNADPDAELWKYDPDACCRLRKVTPLDRALAPYGAWITGRKRHQTLTRVALPVRERVDGKYKINPLAAWTPEQIEAEITARNLPRHPLSTAGYPSIGCATCTRAVAAGEDPRSGRWAGTGKVECGIHRLPETE